MGQSKALQWQELGAQSVESKKKDLGVLVDMLEERQLHVHVHVHVLSSRKKY